MMFFAHYLIGITRFDITRIGITRIGITRIDIDPLGESLDFDGMQRIIAPAAIREVPYLAEKTGVVPFPPIPSEWWACAISSMDTARLIGSIATAASV